MTETEIQAQIFRAINLRRDARLFRNHVGKVLDNRGRWHSFGLAPGSADLIGWRQLVIQPEHVGQTIAQFLSVEVKTPTGRTSDQQRAWLRTVEGHGGMAVIARSISDVIL